MEAPSGPNAYDFELVRPRRAPVPIGDATNPERTDESERPNISGLGLTLVILVVDMVEGTD